MSTIVSMTDKYGTTGNADFRDGRNPSDNDLLEIAKKYNITEEIKVTITDPVKSKTKFTFSVVDGKLVRVSEKKVARNGLTELAEARLQEALSEIIPFEDFDGKNPNVLNKLGMREEDIWREVETRRKGPWMFVPDKYKTAMFNRIVAEHASDLYGTIST